MIRVCRLLDSNIAAPVGLGEFSHSLGQSRRFGDVCGWSAYPSIAADLVQCGETTRSATSGNDELSFR